ncbi:ribonuclease P protein component [Nocardioides zeae]|uniref:Ribonuclease P protein component n=1 Tax=Nocardioides imazamoxiresistens TaxID=3231893 RepID=A0ABU3PUR7_9ACTN|nr:ribonuclease P protein component [Nocardioides zeae]MDT9592972.1 ribonuclease P protein component [Nocardioides zeae]
MLAREQRMRRGDDFAVAVRSGRRAGSRTLVCHWADAEDPLRVGFVVSKAVGPAVTRNRVKRRLRHEVALLLADHALREQGLLVVRALPAAAGAELADLRSDLVRGIRRTGAAA